MNDLGHVATLDLMIELARRSIKRQPGTFNPIVNLIQLVGAMGSVLDAGQRHKVADEMRDMADRVEPVSWVHEDT
jgi:hypothetical protein